MTVFHWARALLSGQQSNSDDEEQPLLEHKEHEPEDQDLLKSCLRSLRASQPFSSNAFATREWLLITDTGTSEFVTASAI